MYILSPFTTRGNIHIGSCKVFKTIPEVQDFLSTITNKWDHFALCPEVYSIGVGKIIKESDEFHREYIYPHTLTSRSKKEQLVVATGLEQIINTKLDMEVDTTRKDLPDV